MAEYHIVACNVLWREICYFASLSRNVFTFDFLPQGLHNYPETLREKLQCGIDRAEGDFEVILIGYGLCSRGIEGVAARDKRLVVARGHDCITHLLGSKERYREYFDANPGTYWYSPGWIDTTLQPGRERYKRARLDYVERFGEENADYLMEVEQGWFKEYTSAAYVDLGFGDNSRYEEYTRQCADWLGWKCDVLRGDPTLVADMLEGRWDAERFLIVEPGQRIVTTNDESIIRSEPE